MYKYLTFVFAYFYIPFSLAITPCNPNPCQNSGTCLSVDVLDMNIIICECLEGYIGSRCEINIDDVINHCDPNPCQNEGDCFSGFDTFSCGCADGFTGELCNVDIDECDPNPCQNGSTCTDGINSFTCTCEDRYIGELCDVDIDNCDPNPCQNGGSCTDGINSFSCDCVNGFTGITCQTSKHVFLPLKCLCYKMQKCDIRMYRNCIVVASSISTVVKLASR